MTLWRNKRNISLAEDTNVYFFTSINIVSNKKYRRHLEAHHTTTQHNTPQHNTPHHTTPHHTTPHHTTPHHTTPHHTTPQQGKAVQNTFPLGESYEMQSLNSLFNENHFCPTLLTFSNMFFLLLQIIISSDWYVTYEYSQWLNPPQYINIKYTCPSCSSTYTLIFSQVPSLHRLIPSQFQICLLWSSPKWWIYIFLSVPKL